MGIGCAVMAALKALPFSVLSIFSLPMCEELGVSMGSISIIFSAVSVGTLIMSLAIGRIVSAHNFRKKRAFFVKGATVAKKCINKSRTIRKKVVRLFTFGVDLKAHDSAF